MRHSYDNEYRCYSDLVKFNTFEDRFDYLKLKPGLSNCITFGYDRPLNQTLYQSRMWKQIRDKIIIRDNACDLGIEGYDLYGNIRIHHMNPITKQMINERNPYVFEEEFLICVSFDTHNAIHYGSITGYDLVSRWKVVERKPMDTVPWKQ